MDSFESHEIGGLENDPIDDDIDAFNDETFGDEGSEYKWEDASNLLFDQEVPTHSNGSASHGLREPVDIVEVPLESSIKKAGPIASRQEVVYDTLANENDLEESISRLVFDDFEDEEIEGNKKKKSSTTNNFAYFMPPQVANKNLNWLMEKELPGSSSLLGSSVWAMHPPSSSSTPPNSITPTSYNSERTQPIQYPYSTNSLPQCRFEPPGLHKVPLVPQEMITPLSREEQIRLLCPPDIRPIQGNTELKTLEEIERELHGETTSGKVLSLQELERELLRDPRNVESRKVVPPGPPGPLQHQLPPHLGQQQLSALEQQRIQEFQIQKQLQLRERAAAQSAPNPNCNLLAYNGVPLGLLRHPPPPHRPPFIHPHPGFPLHQLPRFRQMEVEIIEDPYAGLMNEKDKQRLKNIQIIQLQNDHPYPTDYYCLMNRIKNKQADPMSNRSALVKLFPKRGLENLNKSNYQPMTFENSLGKLQAVSALAPKKAIDTVIRVTDTGPRNKYGVKRYRYLLLEIENMYECLLTIEESDIRNSLICNGDEQDFLIRKKACDKVTKVLANIKTLGEFLEIKKGKMLVSRLIPLVDSNIRYFIMGFMLSTFHKWFEVDNKEMEKGYPYLRHAILVAKHSDIIVIIEKMPKEAFSAMVGNKLGLTILLAIIHQGSKLLENDQKPDNLEFLFIWKTFIVSYLNQIVSHINTLALPIEIFRDIIAHIRSFNFDDAVVEPMYQTFRLWVQAGVEVH